MQKKYRRQLPTTACYRGKSYKDFLFPNAFAGNLLLPTESVNGFTLIELLVVVLIIGILAAVALPQYKKAVEKARMAEGKLLVSAIGKAEQLFFLANGTYTSSFDDLDITIPGVSTAYISSTEALRTNHFLCRPYATGEGIDPTCLGYCTRLPANTIYGLLFMPNGKIVCEWQNTAGENYCKSQGKVSAGNHKIYID